MNSQLDELRRGLDATLNDPFGQLKRQLGRVFTDPSVGALVGGPMAIRPFFHGTTRAAANAIQESGFDLAKFGTGADKHYGLTDALGKLVGFPKGWYGKGVYVTPEADRAAAYAAKVAADDKTRPGVLRTMIDDDTLLNVSGPEAWRQVLPMLARELQIPINTVARMPLAKQIPLINQLAEKLGKIGVLHPEEALIFNPKNISKIEPL